MNWRPLGPKIQVQDQRFYHIYIYIYIIYKAVPLQAWTGPEDSRKLRFPDQDWRFYYIYIIYNI